MQESFLKIIPVIILFLIGYVAKTTKILAEKDADVMLKFVYNLTVPPLVIISISKAQFTAEYIFLPVGALIIILIMYMVSSHAGRWLKLPAASHGVLMVGTMIMNTGFVLPFVYAVYGEEGVVRYTMLDAVNFILMLTFTYFQAIKYGQNKSNGNMYRKFISSIPLWAMIIGLTMNIFNLALPTPVHTSFDMLASATVALTMVSLGVYFEPRFGEMRNIIPAIAIRMGLGFVIGITLAEIAELEGLNRIIFILCASAPIGYTTIVFSGMEGLDKKYASGIVSLSILLGLIATPIMIIFFGQ